MMSRRKGWLGLRLAGWCNDGFGNNESWFEGFLHTTGDDNYSSTRRRWCDEGVWERQKGGFEACYGITKKSDVWLLSLKRRCYVLLFVLIHFMAIIGQYVKLEEDCFVF